MLFHSLEFLIFFIPVYLLFWQVQGKSRQILLLISSCIFYGFWSLPFLLHFLVVVGINYGLLKIFAAYRKKWLLPVLIGLNLLNLSFFKYGQSLLHFLADSVGLALATGIEERYSIILPLAISFYTFQIIAFIVDYWREEIGELNFLRFSVFIMFFPQLISGPIMRHRDFYYKMDEPVLNHKNTQDGLFLIMLGIIKKVFIADAVSVYIQPVWAAPQDYNSLSIFLAILGFSMQVYGDFSGYTDMARGLAKMLGYTIPENFFSPYFAASFADLWKRWHVTLSTWLRDYLYIPLGGNRVSPTHYYFNVILVMSLGGLWHGNTYTFFFWGLCHGIFLSLERILGFDGPRKTKAGILIGWLVTTVGWLIGVALFRAPDLTSAWQMILFPFTESGIAAEGISIVWQAVFAVYLIQYIQIKQASLHKYYERFRPFIIFLMAFILYFMIVNIEPRTEQFIYFQF